MTQSTPGEPRETRASRDAVRAELAVRVADFSTRAYTSQPGVAFHLDDRMRRFTDDDHSADLDLRVSVGAPPDLAQARLLFDHGQWKLLEQAGALYLRFSVLPPQERVFDRVLAFSLERAAADLTVTPHDDAPQPPSPEGFSVNPFEFPLFGLLICWRLAWAGGVCIHSSGVSLDGEGCVFAGVSGAGKTTIATLLAQAGGEILSDDRVAINRAQGAFRIYGTPWQGERRLSQPLSAPLRAIFLIEHGTETVAEPIGAAETCAQLLVEPSAPYFSRELVDRTLTTLAAVTEATPCYRLKVVPDRTAVDVVREALARGS